MNRLGGCRLAIPELSGLAANPDRGLLYGVGDDARNIYTIDVEAEAVVDEVRLEKGKKHDLEGVAFDPSSETWLVVSENRRQLIRYDLEGSILESVEIDLGGRKNSGLEGVTIDVATGRVYVVHERKPRRVVELDAALGVVETLEVDGLGDLSGICAHNEDLWVVSDRSEALCRLQRVEGGYDIARRWDLGRRSAEGIAIMGARIFIGFDVERGDNLEWYDLDASAASA